MPNPCSVCEHPAQAAIDALVLADTRSLASISRDFGLGLKAVQRHARNHVGPRGRQTTTTAPGRPTEPSASPGGSDDPTADESPLDLMRGIVASLKAVDPTTLSPSGQVAHFDSFRRAVEGLAKMQGPAPDLAVTVRQVDGLPELLTRMHQGLKGFPGAREAMAAIWRDYRIETAAGPIVGG